MQDDKEKIDLTVEEKKDIVKDNKIVILPFFKKPKEEEVNTIEELSNFYMEQLVFILNNYGFNVLDDKFQADINLVGLFLKTTLYRSKEHEYNIGISIDELHSMIEETMDIEKSKITKNSRTRSSNKNTLKKKFKDAINSYESGSLSKEQLIEKIESM